MKFSFSIALMALALAVPALASADSAVATPDPARDATREQVRAVLDSAGKRSDVDIAFHQSTKNPYNFAGTATGLTNADSLEVVVSVTKSDTIGFRVYPHYKGGYINTKKARDPSGLKDKLLYLTDQNFLFWGADDTFDVFCGYTFTLESGFPKESIVVVLRSIRNADKFVGEMRPFIDGSGK